MTTIERTTQTVTTTDRILVSVDHYQGSRGDAALIICPGFFQSKDTATFQRLSQALAAVCDVVAMDFRGHGRSGGLFTFSAREGADLEAVLTWARPRYPRLVVMGFSLGAATAINTLARSADGVRGLITVSAPSCFEEIEFKWWTPEAMRTGADGLEAGAGCRPGNLWLAKERPVETVQRLQEVPTLFIHGTHDVIIDVRHSHRLHAAAPGPKHLEIVEGGSHAEALFRDDPEGFLRLVTPWLARTLLSSGG